jgi:hypothetical protein
MLGLVSWSLYLASCCETTSIAALEGGSDCPFWKATKAAPCASRGDEEGYMRCSEPCFEGSLVKALNAKQ